MKKVSVCGEDLDDAQVLHDDHRREIDAGDVRLVLILLSHFPGAAELIGRDVAEAERSDRSIACQPRNTVEIRVVTGEAGQPMGLHDSDDQGVAGEKFELLTYWSFAKSA